MAHLNSLNVLCLTLLRKQLSLGFMGARQTDIAWLAGILEGECCIRPRIEGNKKRSISIQLSMTDKDVVERAMSIFPGSDKTEIHVVDRPDRPQHQRAYVYCWYGEYAIALMKLVYPQMGERRRAKIEECLRSVSW